MKFTLSSPAFERDNEIPEMHTGDGEDLSPSLTWQMTPASTEQLALVCDDPDAPSPQPWVHWVAYNIPGEMHSLPSAIERLPRPEHLAGVTQGENSWSTVGYRGPAPPPGHGVHHYHFRLYALDAELNLEPGLSAEQLMRSIDGHIVGQAELVGVYQRDQ